MHFYGDFTRTQFCGDLLVEHAGDYESHDFALACSQTFVAVSQFRSQTLLSTPGAIAIESLLNCLQEIFIAKRLGQKLDGAGFHRFHRHWNISIAGDRSEEH